MTLGYRVGDAGCPGCVHRHTPAGDPPGEHKTRCLQGRNITLQGEARPPQASWGGGTGHTGTLRRAWGSTTARGPSSASPGGCPAEGSSRCLQTASPVQHLGFEEVGECRRRGSASRLPGRMVRAGQSPPRAGWSVKGEPLRKRGKANAGGGRSLGRAVSRESGFQQELRERAGGAVMRGGGWWEWGRRALEEARSC